MTLFSVFPLVTLLMLIGAAASVENNICKKCEILGNKVRGEFKNGFNDVTPSQLLEKIISVCKQNLPESKLKMCQKIATEKLNTIHALLQAGKENHDICHELNFC
nr:Saposin type B domain containing protein [Haemonchus contortus]